MNFKKKILKSILSGIVFGFSFALSKRFFSSRIGVKPAPPATAPLPTLKRTRPAKSFEFFMDYPRNSLPNSTALIHNGIVMAEAEPFCREFGLDFLLNRPKAAFSVIDGLYALIFDLQEETALFNGKIISTTNCAALINDTVFLPVVLTAQVFDIPVKENKLDRILTIGTPVLN